MIRRLARWVALALIAATSASPGRADHPGRANPFVLYPALMDTLTAGDYSAANDLCRQIADEVPDHPAAIYAEAAVIYARMVAREDTSERGRFFQLADSCVRMCDRTPDSAHERAGLAYLKGSALLAQGVVKMRAGETLAGLSHFMSARREFESAISADPLLWDAYLGRGMYRCAVAQHASLLTFLPFVPDMESGMRDLRVAADSGRWSRYSALTALAWFALNQGNLALADSVCRVGQARFPNSYAFLWPKLSLLVRQRRWAESEKTALQLLRLCEAEPENNGYEMTTLYWRLMVCADSLGRPDDAVHYAEAGLAVRRTDDVEIRRADKTRAMRERIGQAQHPPGGVGSE